MNSDGQRLFQRLTAGTCRETRTPYGPLAPAAFNAWWSLGVAGSGDEARSFEVERSREVKPGEAVARFAGWKPMWYRAVRLRDSLESAQVESWSYNAGALNVV